MTDRQLLLRAETAFKRGVETQSQPDEARRYFREAAGKYRSLIGRGVRNADIFRNLGNAEYLADRLPYAILAWRQGLELAPSDSALRANLQLARKQTAWPSATTVRPPLSVWPAGIPYPATNQIVLLLILVFAGSCICVTRWWMTRRRRWLIAVMLGALIVCGSSAVLVCRQAQSSYNRHHPIVVISAEETALRRGDGQSYPAHEQVPLVFRGMEARLLHVKDDWLQIQFASGQIGWVERSSALVAD